MRQRIRKVVLLSLVLMIFVSLGLSTESEAASTSVLISSLTVGTKFKSGNLKYKISKVDKKSGSVTVLGIVNSKNKLTIPDTVKVKYKTKTGYETRSLKVTSIAKEAFKYNYDLTTISIGRYVDTIGVNAFQGCYKLKSVGLKKAVNLKYIKKGAFSGCYMLTAFNFAQLKKLDTVSDDAFIGCYSLKTKVPYEKMESVRKLSKAAAKYKYIIEPLVAPFNEYFYVRTTNKDMKGVRFIDNKCKKKIEYSRNVIELDQETYIDVKYENATKHKVRGGYIYKSYGSESTVDGGELTLQVYTTQYGWVDTNITVDVPEVTDSSEYIAEKCISGNDFDKNMKAVITELNELYVDYAYLYDTSIYQKSNIRYPYMTSGSYGLVNKTSDIYKNISGSLLAYNSYPFKRNNISSILAGAAKALDPKCTVQTGYYGSITVTRNGQKTTYSVDGYSYDSAIIYKKNVEQGYKFDSSDRDYAGVYSLENVKNRLKRYITKTNTDATALNDQIKNAQSYARFGHCSWLKLYGGKYAYYTQGSWYLNGDYGYKSIKDTWVNGRYVNSHGEFEKGAKLKDHPKADIIKTNVTYKNYYGQVITGDLTYEYDTKTGTWKSSEYAIIGYAVNQWTSTILPEGEEVPADFILTQAQVNAMGVDKNTNANPSHGFIFDGTVAPGTKF